MCYTELNEQARVGIAALNEGFDPYLRRIDKQTGLNGLQLSSHRLFPKQHK